VRICVRAWTGVFSGFDVHQLWDNDVKYDCGVYLAAVHSGGPSYLGASWSGVILCDFPSSFFQVCTIIVAVVRLLAGPAGCDGVMGFLWRLREEKSF
jgi:hypothetical protein